MAPHEGIPFGTMPCLTPIPWGGSNVWPDLVRRERRAHLNYKMFPTRKCQVPLPTKTRTRKLHHTKKRKATLLYRTILCSVEFRLHTVLAMETVHTLEKHPHFILG